MTNPFENNEGTFYVVVNSEGQHSLWPSFAEVPSGWEIATGPDNRDTCLQYVEEQWSDIRPKSLIDA